MITESRNIIILLALSFLSSVNAQQYLPFNKNGKWGAISTNGEVVLEPVFSAIGDFKNGVAPARDQGKWALIDIKGDLLFPFEYRMIQKLFINKSNNPNLWKAKKENGWSIINNQNIMLTPSGYEDFKVYDDFYVATGKDKHYIGKLGDLASISKGYDDVSYKDKYWLAKNGASKIIVNEKFEEVYSRNFKDFTVHRNIFIVAYKNHHALIDSSGEEVLNNCTNLYVTDQLIGGFDNSSGKNFIYKLLSDELILLDEKLSILDTYQDALIVNRNSKIRVIDSDLNELVQGDYINYAKHFDFLSLYLKENLFDIYNSQLEKVVEKVDFINEDGDYYLYRKNSKYGLLKDKKVLLNAEYEYITITTSKIKAYRDNGMTLFTLNNGNIENKTTYSNIVTIKSFGNIPPTLAQSSQSNVNSGGEDEAYGWRKDTTFIRGDTSLYYVKWGVKNDSNFSVKPVYNLKQILNSKASLGYYYKSDYEQFRMINKVPSFSRLDLIDHQEKKVKNKKNIFGLRAFNQSTGIYFATTSNQYLILNHNLDILYDNVPYMERNNNVDRHRFCQNPSELIISSKYDSDEDPEIYTEPLAQWYALFSNYLLWGRDFLIWNEKSIEFKDSKWGYMDDSAKVIIPAVYDYTDAYDGNIGIVYKDGLKGAVNRNTEILAPEFRSIEQMHFENDTLLKVRAHKTASKLWIDSLGNAEKMTFQVLNKSRLNKSIRFKTVKRGNKYGLMNSAGELIIPIEYSKEPQIKENCIILKKRRYGVSDFDGNILIDFTYPVIEAYKDDRVVYKYRNKYGVNDASGEEVVPAEFQLIKLKEGTIYCESRNNSTVFDWNGKQISEKKWHYSDYNMRTNTWVYKKRNKIIVETPDEKFKYKDLLKPIRFIGDYLMVEWSSGKFNLHHIDKDHTPVFKKHYDHIEPINDTIYKVYNGLRYGFRSVKDEEIIPTDYRDLVEIFQGIYAGISRNYLTVYELSGNVLFERRATEVEQSDNGLFLVRTVQGNCIYYNRNMENHFFEVYDNATRFNDGFASISKAGSWTIINKHGEELFEPSFSSIVPVARNKFYASTNLLFGLYDTNGNEILPCEYDQIEHVTEDIIRVTTNGNIGYLRTNGGWILKPEHNISLHSYRK